MDPDFIMWRPKTETADHMLFFEECTLYVPVGQLNMEINRSLAQHLKAESAIYSFRELVCNNHAISKGHLTYESPDLRAPAQAAIKIYVAFVKATAFLGKQVMESFYIGSIYQ